MDTVEKAYLEPDFVVDKEELIECKGYKDGTFVVYNIVKDIIEGKYNE